MATRPNPSDLKGRSLTSDQPSKAIASIAALTWAAWLVWIAATALPQHDYVAYVKQWQLVLDGLDPWSTNNAYGPIHNLLAYLLPLGSMAPRVLIVGSFAAAILVLFRELWDRSGPAGAYGPILLAVATNVLIIGLARYGLNDLLCAAMIVVAVVLRVRGSLVLCGTLLGAAALLKFYPLVLVPFFALDRRDISWRIAVAALSTFVLGMFAAYLCWGASVFDPLIYGSARGPKLLSVLATLEYLFGRQGVVRLLVRLDLALVILAAAAGLAVAYVKRLDWLSGAVLGFLGVLAFYKVGHQQFYVSWLVLVAALPLVGGPRLAFVCIPFALFLSLFQWGYQFVSNERYLDMPAIRGYVGAIAFGLSVATIWIGIRAATAPGSISSATAPDRRRPLDDTDGSDI